MQRSDLTDTAWELLEQLRGTAALVELLRALPEGSSDAGWRALHARVDYALRQLALWGLLAPTRPDAPDDSQVSAVAERARDAQEVWRKWLGGPKPSPAAVQLATLAGGGGDGDGLPLELAVAAAHGELDGSAAAVWRAAAAWYLADGGGDHLAVAAAADALVMRAFGLPLALLGDAHVVAAANELHEAAAEARAYLPPDHDACRHELLALGWAAPPPAADAAWAADAPAGAPPELFRSLARGYFPRLLQVAPRNVLWMLQVLGAREGRPPPVVELAAPKAADPAATAAERALLELKRPQPRPGWAAAGRVRGKDLRLGVVSDAWFALPIAELLHAGWFHYAAHLRPPNRYDDLHPELGEPLRDGMDALAVRCPVDGAARGGGRRRARAGARLAPALAPAVAAAGAAAVRRLGPKWALYYVRVAARAGAGAPQLADWVRRGAVRDAAELARLTGLSEAALQQAAAALRREWRDATW